MKNAAVLYSKKDTIATITINRPHALNAINSQVWEGLQEAWFTVRDDPEVCVAVVTGAGERAFSAGADLKEQAEYFATPEDKRLRKHPTPEVTPMRGIEVWKPFIAAINGLCLGGGLELALACDMRVAADTALLGFPEVRHGLIPGMSGTQRLVRHIPFGAALEMLMTGQHIDAREALRIGLVNQVVPAAELAAKVGQLALRICANGLAGLIAAKRVAYTTMKMNLDWDLRLDPQTGQWSQASDGSSEDSSAISANGVQPDALG